MVGDGHGIIGIEEFLDDHGTLPAFAQTCDLSRSHPILHHACQVPSHCPQEQAFRHEGPKRAQPGNTGAHRGQVPDRAGDDAGECRAIEPRERGKAAGNGRVRVGWEHRPPRWTPGRRRPLPVHDVVLDGGVRGAREPNQRQLPVMTSISSTDMVAKPVMSAWERLTKGLLIRVFQRKLLRHTDRS